MGGVATEFTSSFSPTNRQLRTLWTNSLVLSYGFTYTTRKTDDVDGVHHVAALMASTSQALRLEVEE